MRIGIVGPGALGCLLACRLSSAGLKYCDILLFDHRNERAALLNKQGIICESDGVEERVSLPVSSTPKDSAPVDLLFLTVKSHDLQNSLRFTNPLITSHSLLIFMQNGITHLNLEESQGMVGIPAFATSSEGATTLGPGHVRHGGCGHTHLGFLSPRSQTDNSRLQELVTCLQKGGMEASVSRDIRSRLWAKLFINAGINGLTAIYDLTNGQLLSTPDTRNKLEALVREAEAVARASGVTIKQDPVTATIEVCRRTASNVSSMLQDVRNCRPTEIEAINGAVSRLGKELHIATPVNDEVIAKVKALEAEYETN